MRARCNVIKAVWFHGWGGMHRRAPERAKPARRALVNQAALRGVSALRVSIPGASRGGTNPDDDPPHVRFAMTGRGRAQIVTGSPGSSHRTTRTAIRSPFTTRHRAHWGVPRVRPELSPLVRRERWHHRHVAFTAGKPSDLGVMRAYRRRKKAGRATKCRRSSYSP
jgi:hypothetical protein